MNNDLLNTLVQRQMNQSTDPSISSPTKIPQEAKRYANTQQIQSAYANNWSPNPVLLRATLGNK